MTDGAGNGESGEVDSGGAVAASAESSEGEAPVAESSRTPDWLPLGVAGLLGLCCISVSAVFGGAAVLSGSASVTAVSTGVTSLRGIVVTTLVTLVTLGPIYLVWRRRTR